MRVEFDASGVDFEVIVELSEHADAFELSNNTVIAINPDEHFMKRLHELNIPHKVSEV